ncbi:unnamed protein product [Oikopleura dioica]|uniref:Uncharacterized protein n=1 Tax=Oikopleura dioica TaxID=34765 RepID=E4YD17_OIKDI|nr:unnamed protein product [Oikopleura dioica]
MNTISFETYDALDSVQETIEENLLINSEETLKKLQEDEAFKDLKVEEIKELANNTEVDEEILPELGAYSTFLEYFDCEDKDEESICSICREETCECTVTKDVSVCDAFFYYVDLDIYGKTTDEQAEILDRIEKSINLTVLEDESEACEECFAETTKIYEITTNALDFTTENSLTTETSEETTEQTENSSDTTTIFYTTSADEQKDEEVTILAIILSASYGALCLTALIGSVFYIFKSTNKSFSVVLFITVLTVSIANGIQITFYLINKMDEATFLGSFILTLIYGAFSVPTLLY